MKFSVEELNKALKETDISKLSTDPTKVSVVDIVAAIIAIWGTVRVLLKLAKVFTDDEMDKKIDEIILWGDALKKLDDSLKGTNHT